jgi:hypothetical protein
MALLVRPDRPTTCSTEPSEGTVRPDSLNRDFRLAVAFCASFPGFPYRRDAQYKSQPKYENLAIHHTGSCPRGTFLISKRITYSPL